MGFTVSRAYVQVLRLVNFAKVRKVARPALCIFIFGVEVFSIVIKF